MGQYVSNLAEVDKTMVAVVGGKGAHVGELCRIEGVSVPPGFCVTTEAFRRVVLELGDRLDRLARLKPDAREQVRDLSEEIRDALSEVVIPEDIVAAITDAVAAIGEQVAYAVRSSATAEDMPTASFAGQHDTYLNVVGSSAIVEHVRRCWASLFTERAVSYRLRNGVDHRNVQMAVVVQQMVPAHASGVLFTAHPVTGNRKVASVESVFGLGEALVSGVVDADVYEVRDGEVIATRLAQEDRTMTDGQLARLNQLGRRIEAHFGRPQDIEWCRVDDELHVVQARPITTLFPVPAAGDTENHVYVSVGHQQMMTDAMKPLGISLFQLTAARPMYEAGGRLFVDVTKDLASPAGRAGLIGLAGKSDPLVGDALERVIERDFVPMASDEQDPPARPRINEQPEIETDPAIVAELIQDSRASVEALAREIQTKSGPALLDFILDDIGELKRMLFDSQSLRVIMSGIRAAWWLNEQLEGWLGEKNPADAFAQSVPDNVTSEMGLALLDVADAIRPHPEVVAFLQNVADDRFLDELPALSGGPEAADAIRGWLGEYGMRCAGEIDITRPRWSERPTALLPVILAHVRNFQPGERERRFERGLAQARDKEREVLERLRALPDGEQKAEETKRMIDRVRTFSGYREYPKYGIVSRYFVYKQALSREAGRLVRAGVLRDVEDIFYLTFEELHEVTRTNRADTHLIDRRKEAFRWHETLTPPRVLTSDGEVFAGAYRRSDVPHDALVGIAVCAGVVEGRARVILDMARAELQPGDILVTTYTDPSWTPLFVAISGLVTEVGGLMSHGAVVAREYGLPAVVGVQHAARLIVDGQRIRVNGTQGYVELLP